MITKYRSTSKIDPVFIEKINQFKLLSREEMGELFKKFRNDSDINARNKIIEHNLRLVPKMVRKWMSVRTIDQMDLLGICNAELLKIVGNFDEERGYKFEHYAHKCIGKRIFRVLKQTLIIAIPEHLWKNKECRERSKVFLEESLANEDGDGLSMASFKGKEPSAELIVMAKDELKKIRHEIKEILDFIVGCGNIKRKKKAKIFKERYGLLDGSLDIRILNDIANVHNVTREAVRKLIIRLWVNISKKFPQKDERWFKHQIQRFKDMMDFMEDDDVESLNLKFEE